MSKLMLSIVQVVSYYIHTYYSNSSSNSTYCSNLRILSSLERSISENRLYKMVLLCFSSSFVPVFFVLCSFVFVSFYSNSIFILFRPCNHHILKTLHYLYDLFKLLLLLLVIGNIYMEANIELLVSISSSQIQARLKDGWVISRS
jgi:hypothetical protein